MHIWTYAFYKDLLFWRILHFRIDFIRQSLPFKAILFGNFIGTQRSYALKEMNISNEAICPERARQDVWTSRWLPRSGIQMWERPNRFCLNATNFKGKKKSPVFTQHCFTFNFHEDNNSRGIFLTSLSLLVFKKHTFLYMHIRQKHSLKIQPSYLFLPFYAFFFFYSCLCYITLAFYLFRLIIFY